MAFKKDIFFTPEGFDSPAVLKDAYCRVEGVSGGKSGVAISLICYRQEGDKLTVGTTFSRGFVPVVGDGATDFIAQAYTYLKTLPEFAGAVDC